MPVPVAQRTPFPESVYAQIQEMGFVELFPAALAAIRDGMLHWVANQEGEMLFLVRLVKFALLFLVITPGTYVLRLLVWPSVLYSERLDRRLRRSVLVLWSIGFIKVFGIRVVVHGPRPKPPFYIVANHLSYVDMLLLTRLTGAIFVSRGDVQHWPIIGLMARSLYILFIDRRDKRDTVRVNRLIDHTLKMGDGLAVFAESRISRGLDVEPFKSALIQPAIDNGIPVHYVTLSYETRSKHPPANEVVGWWRPEGFFPHIFRLLGYPGFTATVHFGPEPIEGTDRKKLARQLHEAVRANFTPVK